MTSIAPVSLNNIDTQWRCGLKSVFSGDVHSRKKSLVVIRSFRVDQSLELKFLAIQIIEIY